jgi:hypothetical protein
MSKNQNLTALRLGLAQLVEQRTVTPQVASSNLAAEIRIFFKAFPEPLLGTGGREFDSHKYTPICICNLVVEYAVANGDIRVRFPANANFTHR